MATERSCVMKMTWGEVPTFCSARCLFASYAHILM